MKTLIKKKTTIDKKDNLIILCKKNSNLSQYNLSSKEQDFIKKDKGEIVTINQYNRYVFVVKPKENSNLDFYNENCRLIGDKLIEKLTSIKSVVIISRKDSFSSEINFIFPLVTIALNIFI